MKKYSLLTGLVICCGFASMQGVAYAQKARPTRPITQTTSQIDALVNPTLESCEAPQVQTTTAATTTARTPTARTTSARTTAGSATTASAPARRVQTTQIHPSRVVPTEERRVFPTERIAKTLHGIWRGEVKGDTSDLNVDYFWIIDTNLNEALIIAQRSGKNTLGPSQLPNPPKLTYLMCAHDGYSPGTSVPQIHEFTKVYATTDNAARIVQEATGLEDARPGATPTELWQGLLRTEYFNGLPYVAFAGALFKPIRIEQVPNANLPPEIFLGWDAEYRGGGSTKIRYTTGLPLIGKERAQFIGASAGTGDYLLASPGNGSIYKVEMIEGYEAYYDLAFDSVSLGPLE